MEDGASAEIAIVGNEGILGISLFMGGEKDFGPKTKTFGLEVFRDENNGNWIYICETGSIAVVPGK